MNDPYVADWLHMITYSSGINWANIGNPSAFSSYTPQERQRRQSKI